jgi:dedicator of cytokinesis protein 3
LPLDKPPTLFTRLNSDKASRASPSHHLLLDFKAFIASPCAPGETAELFFSLYNQNENRFVTEEFHLVLNHLGSPARDSEQRLGRLKTLFTELKPEDLSNHVYLVCKVVRNGALKMRSEAMTGTLDSQHRSGMTRSRSGNLLGEMGTIRENVSNDALTEDSFSVTSGSRQVNALDRTMTSTESIVDGRPSYRRPLGCAVIEMPLLSKLVSDAQGTEVIMPIYIPRDEASFATLHEDVIHRRSKEFYTTSR